MKYCKFVKKWKKVQNKVFPLVKIIFFILIFQHFQAVLAQSFRWKFSSTYPLLVIDGSFYIPGWSVWNGSYRYRISGSNCIHGNF